MQSEQLFSVALGLSGGWKVTKCEFSGSPKSLKLWIDFERGSRFAAPGSEGLCPVHDTVEKSWRHLNFFQFTTVLTARVPRVRTPEGKVVQVEVPWARPESGFTLMMEALVVLLCQQMPVNEVAALLGECDTRLWRVLRHYVEQAQRDRSWAEVRRIMVDETSARRGHRYVTNFVDAETRELLFMAEGRDAECLKLFCEELSQHQATPDQIELIAMDMSVAYRKGASDFFPRARVVFDHFHLMQMAGKALDDVRKQLFREGADLKDSLWSIRGNEWTRSQEQIQRRRQLCSQYPKLGRAMMLRETFQDVLADENVQSLKWWCRRAKLSRLLPFRKLALTIQANWDGVVAFIETRLTNGAIEAINGLIQLAKRMARGFRSFRNFRIMAYLKAGKLTLNLPKLLPT